MSIGQVSKLLGVSISTLRRWEKEDKLIPDFRTKGNHRRYSLQKIKEEFFPHQVITSHRKTIAYARVSSHDQKDDLLRQAEQLKEYGSHRGWAVELITDLGSGIKYDKRGLTRLLKLVCTNQVDRILLTHKDRLLRFGSQLIFKICEQYGTEVIVIKESEPESFEQEVVQDVLQIMTVFCSKIYGKRSHENRQRRAVA